MKELDLNAEPQLIFIDIVRAIEKYIESLDDDVEFDLEDGQYPSQMAFSNYDEIEEVLKKQGIDVKELNEKINKAIFGEEGCIKYYPFKEVEE